MSSTKKASKAKAATKRAGKKPAQRKRTAAPGAAPSDGSMPPSEAGSADSGQLGADSGSDASPSPPQPAMEADMVVLRNISSEAFTVNLTHEDYCRKAGECLCRWARLRMRPQRMDGSGGVQEQKVRRNASITILAKSKSRPLHRAVLDVPGVQSAMRAPNQRLISLNGG